MATAGVWQLQDGHEVIVARYRHASSVDETKSGRSWSESSSSGDGEDEVLAYEAQWAEETALRELREENQRPRNEGEKPSVQFEEAGEEV